MQFENEICTQFYQKMYKKEFFYSLYMILSNNYVVFKPIYKNKAFRVFKQKLAEEILEKNLPTRKTSQ